MDAVIYLRSARPNPVNLLRQREQCEAFARQHGHEVVTCYVDFGRGRSTLHALIEEAEEQKIGSVFVFGLSRISRNPSDFTRDAVALHEAGCTIYDASTCTVYEPENATARFMLSTVGILAEFDAERIDRERRIRRALTR